MQENFIHWLDSIFAQGIPDFWAWKLYTFPPGNHPWIFHAEAAAYPEGFWWSRKLPLSYYSNKTVFYHWPSDLSSWSQWLRESKLGTSSSAAYSYKQWHCGVLLATPYWSKVSFWELCSYLFTGRHGEFFKPFFTYSNQVCIFHSPLVDVQIINRPYYFDAAWNDWFLYVDNINHSSRYGVCRSQFQVLWFLRSFFLGYWFAFLMELPWPHRLLLPKDVSGWRWLKMIRNFFRSFNVMNPIILWFSLAFLALSFIYSQVTEYVLWDAPLKDLAFQQIPLWLYFLWYSFLLLAPMARFSKILGDYRQRHNLTQGVRLVLNIFLPRNKLWRDWILYTIIFIWHWGSICFYLFLFWALTPLWGYLPLFIGKVFWFLLKCVYLLSFKLWLLVSYLWWKVSFFLFVRVFDLEYTAFGEFILDKDFLLWFESLVPFYHYLCFYLRTIPLIVFGLACWILTIIWPLLSPYLRKALIRNFPWAFVTEISVKTRLKYGLYLLYMYVRKKIF